SSDREFNDEQVHRNIACFLSSVQENTTLQALRINLPDVDDERLRVMACSAIRNHPSLESCQFDWGMLWGQNSSTIIRELIDKDSEHRLFSCPFPVVLSYDTPGNNEELAINEIRAALQRNRSICRLNTEDTYL